MLSFIAELLVLFEGLSIARRGACLLAHALPSQAMETQAKPGSFKPANRSEPVCTLVKVQNTRRIESKNRLAVCLRKVQSLHMCGISIDKWIVCAKK